VENILNTFYNEVLNFILPPVCLSCESLLSNGNKYLCDNCSSSIVKINNDADVILSALNSDSPISKVYSLYLFQETTPIQTLMHALKYGQMRRIGVQYGSLLANEVLMKSSLSVDYIIPVPLHISKKRERGYNQSDFICEGISRILQTRVLKKCLKRKRFTQTQTKLTREERMKNVSGAFELRNKFRDLIKSKNILIVDDVITTGSTILECSKVLKDAGCGEINACSIAFAE